MLGSNDANNFIDWCTSHQIRKVIFFYYNELLGKETENENKPNNLKKMKNNSESIRKKEKPIKVELGRTKQETKQQGTEMKSHYKFINLNLLKNFYFY